MNRVSRLLLVGYLYLHLGVLFLLTRGPGSRTSVVAPFKNPYFPGLESLLILVILVHALNGLRLALVGSGAGVSHQKVLFVSAMSVSAVLIAAAAIAAPGQGIDAPPLMGARWLGRDARTLSLGWWFCSTARRANVTVRVRRLLPPRWDQRLIARCRRALAAT